MEIRLLRYFSEVARSKSISRAAEVLHITQPALSRSMREIEEEAGEALFVRGRNFQLTDAGELMRCRASEIVRLMDKFESDMRARADLAGVISLGCGLQWAVNVVVESLIKFRRKYPRVTFNVYTNGSDYIEEQMDRGVLDFGVLLEPIDISKYDFIRLAEPDRWGIIMAANNPLAAKNFVTAEDIRPLPLIMTSRRELQSEVCHRLGVPLEELNIVGQYKIITNLLPLVAQGSFYALATDSTAQVADPQRLTFRPLEPALTMTSVLAWKKPLLEFGAAGKFKDFFAANYKKAGKDQA